jgi:hypothetical protein
MGTLILDFLVVVLAVLVARCWFLRKEYKKFQAEALRTVQFDSMERAFLSLVCDNELVGAPVSGNERPALSWRGIVSRIWIEDGKLQVGTKDVEFLTPDGSWEKSSKEGRIDFHFENSNCQIRVGEVLLYNQFMEVTITPKDS